MKNVVAGLLVVLFVGVVQTSHAVPTLGDAEGRVATRQGIRAAKRWLEWEPPTLETAVLALRDVYGVRISYEHAFVGPDRRSVDEKPIKFSLHEGQTLRDALDSLCASSGTLYVWKRVNGILVLMSNRSIGLDELVDSALDVRVSLDLDGVSAWEAILALLREVNSNIATDRVMRTFIPADPHPNHPQAFQTEKSLSVHVSDVTAREALCTIIATSPFAIEFSYSNSFEAGNGFPSPKPTSTLSLVFYEDEKMYGRHSSRRVEEQLEMKLDVEKTIPVGRRQPRYRNTRDVEDLLKRLASP